MRHANRDRRVRRAIAALLAFASFALHLGLEREFDRVGALSSRDWLFDADPNSRLKCVSEYHHLGLKHPNLMPYFSPPIGALAKLVVWGAPSGTRERDVARALGKLIVPVASALQTALTFLLFCRLGYSLAAAVIATLLSLVSLSGLVFGSMPESYGVTALALALMYVFAAGSGRERSPKSIAIWIVLGVFATGVTITNLVYVPIFVFALALERGSPLRSAAIRATVFGIAILAATGASAWVLDRLLVPPKAETSETLQGTLTQRVAQPGLAEFHKFFAPDPLRKLAHFPTILANAFAPPSATWTSEPPRPRKPGFTLENTPSAFGSGDPLGASILLLMLAGACCALVHRSTRALALASIAILAFSAALSTWGTEAFLYSLNWQLGSVVLIAGVMRFGAAAKWMTGVLAVLTAAIAINNIALLRAILAALATQIPLIR